MSSVNFETPLRLNLDPQSKFFPPRGVKLFFLKGLNAQPCSSKIKCVKAKFFREGALKAPPPGSYRVKKTVVIIVLRIELLGLSKQTVSVFWRKLLLHTQ